MIVNILLNILMMYYEVCTIGNKFLQYFDNSKMDLDFVEERHREDILKLMEVCGIDLMEAYQLFQNANHSFDAAVNMHFNQGSSQNSNSNQNFPSFDEPAQDSKPAYQHEDFDGSYDNYKTFKQSGLTFTDKYEVRKQTGFISSFIPKFLKGTPQSSFKKKMQEFTGRSCQIKYLPNSLSETISQYGWKEKFPLIIQTVSFQPQLKAKISEIMRESTIIDYCNVQFRTYGIDLRQYELQNDLQPYIDLKKDKNLFILLRVNVCDEIQVLDKIDFLNLSVKDLIHKIKVAKNICINRQIEETHMEKRYGQELMGNYDYQKPMSFAEKRKVAQDRALRKKQEEQFYASMKAQEERQKKEQPNNPKPTPQVPQSNQKKEEKVEVQPKKINWQEKRQKIRENLPTYESGITLKLRVPNGEGIIIVAAFEEKVKYLYDYIFSLEKDLGFENQERKFDIVRPYDRLNLSQNMDKTLKEVFEDSDMESLIVTEIE